MVVSLKCFFFCATLASGVSASASRKRKAPEALFKGQQQGEKRLHKEVEGLRRLRPGKPGLDYDDSRHGSAEFNERIPYRPRGSGPPPTARTPSELARDPICQLAIELDHLKKQHAHLRREFSIAPLVGDFSLPADDLPRWTAMSADDQYDELKHKCHRLKKIMFQAVKKEGRVAVVFPMADDEDPSAEPIEVPFAGVEEKTIMTIIMTNLLH